MSLAKQETTPKPEGTMRIEINERGPKEFYDEIMYIAANYKKYRAKPGKKAHSQSVVYTGYCVVTLLVVLLFMLEFLKDHDGIFLLLSGMMLVCFILFIVIVVSMKKRIKVMMEEPGTKVVEVNDSGVSYESEAQSVKIKWDEITNVIINRNSIIFMPRTEIALLISVYIKYKEQILQGIDAAGRMYLVVDNTLKK